MTQVLSMHQASSRRVNAGSGAALSWNAPRFSFFRFYFSSQGLS